ncbi:hypothetical protein CEE37_13655 [candidate division LCP-89 bacterium B3_LCP]|uniref:Metallo-beta-lactamase domain-containing protein n=1 Tax=candidate division LCP-89 bacterium B3_LCP TaxID=2012998 RepID=A0A532URX4_UNCL8|nr:MAG: hypothetical protein CEE37_13655 [candidate division LCP-89 bacterium B3_LCP]
MKLSVKHLIAGILFLLSSAAFCSADVRFHFIAVGHGDAILIEEEGMGIALVDAGRPETAANVLTYLNVLGINRIEHLFVTHTHDDHIGGIPAILDSLDIGIVHHTGMVDEWDTAETFFRYMATGNWLEETVGTGDVPLEMGNLKIEVLNPQLGETEGRSVDPNPNSLVLLVTHGEVKVLLTADIYKKRERWLVEKYGDYLCCDAMKASHHASKMGNSKALLQTVKPDVIVVSVGVSKWGYPAEKTMKRLRQFCPHVLRTDFVGTVVLQSDGISLIIRQPEGVNR